MIDEFLKIWYATIKRCPYCNGKVELADARVYRSDADTNDIWLQYRCLDCEQAVNERDLV